jgi:hypothetical protein
MCKRTKYIYKNRLPSRVAEESASGEAALLAPGQREEAFWGWVRRSSIDGHSRQWSEMIDTADRTMHRY